MASSKSDRSTPSGGASSFLTSAGSKLRQINPNAAKESSRSGIAGVKDLASTAVAYAKQETVGPLKGLGRYALWGFISAIFFATALILAALGALRGLQAATGADDVERGGLDGSYTWLPYLMAVGVCVVLLAIVGFCAVRATRPSSASRSGDRT